MKRATGFTLLEVLVALAVLAIAMGAIINAATQSIASTAYLRDQTFAGWVTLNKVNELLLDPEPWPEEGSQQGNAELANRAWRWEARFAKTDDPDLRRLEVTVRSAENASALSVLTAFKAKPPELPTGDQSNPDPAAGNPTPEDQSPRSSPPKGRPSTTPR
ncbi:MAG: type II secretion system minor pseudopilin GspI [Candidatus Competibacteraceae bacterium]|nr:type II secretion system minor pseudopilin GspI [Candidatus Competibacteraceae bacterium]